MEYIEHLTPMTQALTPHFQDAVESLLEDWRGQDEMFYHTAAQTKIYWYCGKVRSLEQAMSSAEIRANRTKFLGAVAKGYGMELRRLQEARAVYKKFYKPADSLKETCERIFQEVGSWSKALPAKKEAEVEPPDDCQHLFICKKCGADKMTIQLHESGQYV
jgi:hypothetical protein